MTKKMVKYEKGADDLLYAETLTDLLTNVQRYIDQYGADVELEIDSGHSNLDVILTLEREETDKEYNKRLKDKAREKEQALAKKEIQERKERKELERLMKKYGDKQ